MDVVALGLAKAAVKAQAAIQAAVDRRHRSALNGLAPISTRLIASASRAGGVQWSDGVATSKFQRIKVTITADARDLRLEFGNYSYGVTGLNPFSVTAAIETVNPSVSYPLTFGGRAQGTVDPGAVLRSDALGIAVKKGDVLWLRSYVSVTTAGQKWPAGVNHWAAGEAVSADADLTASTGTTGITGPLAGVGGGYVAGFGPTALLGSIAPTTPIFGLWGDSITVGLNDWAAEEPQGWAERALAGQYVWVNVSKHTERASNMNPLPASGSGSGFTPVAYQHKTRYDGGVTHGFTAYGVNDIGDALATIQANLVAHWTDRAGRGIKLWQYTLPPTGTSTDGYITLGGQTAGSNEAKRVALNTWIRDGAPILAGVAVASGSSAVGTLRAGDTGHPLRGYVETADAVESSRNSGKWKLPERSVTDAVGTVSGFTITSATANFTSADIGKTIVLVGAGASGANLVTTISNVTASTSASISSPAPATAVSGALLHIGAMTGDGIHPRRSGYMAMGAAVQPLVATIAAA